jgi:hypothetical protein
MNPLILTLTLDPVSQAFFDRERLLWFPPAINLIPAHVTLFHHLPGDGRDQILGVLRDHCARHPAMPFTAEGLRFLGRGVAYRLHAPGAAKLRASLAEAWNDHLTPQDRQAWRPHVTIQNKADPAAARALHQRLARDFTPFEGLATGLHLWRYLGGPWASETILPFSGA